VALTILQCDERRPACSLCLQKNSTCTYPPTPRSRRSPPCSLPSRVPSPLWPGQHTLLVLANDNAYTKYDLDLLHHFVTTASKHFTFLGSDDILSSKAVELGKEYPIVMHAILAVSACHLQALGCKARPYRIPESFHCQHAIRGLHKAVVTFNGVKEADSVLTTAMLLNSLVSTKGEYFDGNQNRNTGELRWGWLRFQIGITDLLMRTKPYHPQSIWLPMFLSSKQRLPISDRRSDLDRQLAELCGIDQDSTAEDNPYFDFWVQLAPLVIRAPGPQYMRWYVEAMGGVDLRFIELLEKQDIPALMLFAHWAALMSSLESWAVSRSLNKICWKICKNLQLRMKISELHLLGIPAEAVGFSLSY
jgi:hypothetical protein